MANSMIYFFSHWIGKPRGYIIASRFEGTGRLTLFKISSSFSVTVPGAYTQDVSEFVSKWQSWLADECPAESTEESLITLCVDRLATLSNSIASCVSVLSTQIDAKCFSDMAAEHVCAVKNLLKEIEGANVFKVLKENLQRVQNIESLERIGRTSADDLASSAKRKQCCLTNGKLSVEHFIYMFIMCWPYNMVKGTEHTNNAQRLNPIVTNSLGQGSVVLANEVQILRRQFTVLLNMRKIKGKCETCCGKSDCKSPQ